MKRKFLIICAVMMFSLTGLVGCSAKEEVVESEYPAGAIFPVIDPDRGGLNSTTIPLTDFNFKIPRGYVYGKVDYKEGYTVYYVWQDKRDKEYSFELDSDVLLYIYDGSDESSLHKEINKGQALSSMKGSYMANFANFVTLRNRMPDAEAGVSDDQRYFTFTFTGNSGDYVSTTYSEMCYPKTYYGIYALESYTNDASRQYYGFIFSNDSEGEIFKQSEYENLMSQIKTQFSVSKFYGVPGVDPAIDYSDGRSYRQLVGDVIYEKEGTNYFERGLFYNTLLYYVETTDRTYIRRNVDAAKYIPTPEPSISEETLFESEEISGQAVVEDGLNEGNEVNGSPAPSGGS